MQISPDVHNKLLEKAAEEIFGKRWRYINWGLYKTFPYVSKKLAQAVVDSICAHLSGEFIKHSVQKVAETVERNNNQVKKVVETVIQEFDKKTQRTTERTEVRGELVIEVNYGEAVKTEEETYTNLQPESDIEGTLSAAASQIARKISVRGKIILSMLRGGHTYDKREEEAVFEKKESINLDTQQLASLLISALILKAFSDAEFASKWISSNKDELPNLSLTPSEARNKPLTAPNIIMLFNNIVQQELGLAVKDASVSPWKPGDGAEDMLSLDFNCVPPEKVNEAPLTYLQFGILFKFPSTQEYVKSFPTLPPIYIGKFLAQIVIPTGIFSGNLDKRIFPEYFAEPSIRMFYWLRREDAPKIPTLSLAEVGNELAALLQQMKKHQDFQIWLECVKGQGELARKIELLDKVLFKPPQIYGWLRQNGENLWKEGVFRAKLEENTKKSLLRISPTSIEVNWERAPGLSVIFSFENLPSVKVRFNNVIIPIDGDTYKLETIVTSASPFLHATSEERKEKEVKLSFSIKELELERTAAKNEEIIAATAIKIVREIVAASIAQALPQIIEEKKSAMKSQGFFFLIKAKEREERQKKEEQNPPTGVPAEFFKNYITLIQNRLQGLPAQEQDFYLQVARSAVECISVVQRELGIPFDYNEDFSFLLRQDEKTGKVEAFSFTAELKPPNQSWQIYINGRLAANNEFEIAVTPRSRFLLPTVSTSVFLPRKDYRNLIDTIRMVSTNTEISHTVVEAVSSANIAEELLSSLNQHPLLADIVKTLAGDIVELKIHALPPLPMWKEKRLDLPVLITFQPKAGAEQNAVAAFLSSMRFEARFTNTQAGTSQPSPPLSLEVRLTGAHDPFHGEIRNDLAEVNPQTVVDALSESIRQFFDNVYKKWKKETPQGEPAQEIAPSIRFLADAVLNGIIRVLKENQAGGVKQKVIQNIANSHFQRLPAFLFGRVRPSMLLKPEFYNALENLTFSSPGSINWKTLLTKRDEILREKGAEEQQFLSVYNMKLQALLKEFSNKQPVIDFSIEIPEHWDYQIVEQRELKEQLGAEVSFSIIFNNVVLNYTFDVKFEQIAQCKFELPLELVKCDVYKKGEEEDFIIQPQRSVTECSFEAIITIPDKANIQAKGKIGLPPGYVNFPLSKIPLNQFLSTVEKIFLIDETRFLGEATAQVIVPLLSLVALKETLEELGKLP